MVIPQTNKQIKLLFNLFNFICEFVCGFCGHTHKKISLHWFGLVEFCFFLVEFGLVWFGRVWFGLVIPQLNKQIK